MVQAGEHIFEVEMPMETAEEALEQIRSLPPETWFKTKNGEIIQLAHVQRVFEPGDPWWIPRGREQRA